jgi:AcrR family transcriptional regulator
VGGNGLAELGAVVHREVGAFPVGRRQMRGVAEKSHTGHTLPPMPGRERMEPSRDGVCLTVGDQRGELRRPAVELRRDSSLRRPRVGEVDARYPLLRPRERDVGVQDAAFLAVGIELLDAEGENGLTFRALATRLATGPGAIYWHIANKSELLVAAGDAVVARALADVGASGTPRKTIRSIAMGVFEAIDAHPWVGAQLSRNPWPTAMLQIFERTGRQVQALRVPDGAQFTAAMVLVSYIVGESRQNAANGLLYEPSPDRADFLETVSDRWKELDAHEYPFTRSVASHLREHDDRAEFLAGIDLILNGVAASLPPVPRAAPAKGGGREDRS